MVDPLAEKSKTQPTGPANQVLGILRKRLWLIIGITVSAAAATGLVVSKQPRIYEATASIVIELSVPQYLGSGFRDVVEVEPSWWHSRETLATEFRTLNSRSQAIAVARDLCARKLDGKPALNKMLPEVDCAKPSDLDGVVPVLQGMLRVAPVKDTRIVELTVSSQYPELAALAANTVARVYEQRNLERRLSHSADAASWLGDEYQQLVTELRQAEDALTEFKSANNIVTPSLEDDQNEISLRRKKLAEQLGVVEVELLALKAEKLQLEATPADALLDANPTLAKSTVAQKLKELWTTEYGKLIDLQGKYLERHPAILAQEKRLAQLKEDLKREGATARAIFESQYQLLTKQASDLRVALDQATRQAIKVESKNAEYNRLKRDLERLIKLTEQVGGRERETSLASNLRTNNIRVLDQARIPILPVSPNVPRAVLVAIAAALLLSVALALALEALDNTVKTQDDVERTVGLTLLGLVPTIDVERNGVAPGTVPLGAADERDTYVLSHPNSQVAECCRAIRTNLLFMSPDKPNKTMLISSAGPQEGKTTVAVSLAITLAQSGLRVLLVDTDMRRPRVHKALGIPSSAEGVSSAILGHGSASSYIRSTVVPNLYVLPCGACPPNPAELLHVARFRAMVAELAEEFDRVLFDSPPVGVVTDPSILARITDATLLVAKAGRTSKHALARALRQLGPDVNLLGCVLNNLDLSKQREYGYYSYYYSRYGYYAAPETPPRPGQTGQA